MTVHELVEALQKLPPQCYGYEVALSATRLDGEFATAPNVRVDDDEYDNDAPVVWL